MATIDYKEKYDEALKVAQRFYNNSVAITKKGLEDIFPELKESEDERIRNAFREHLMTFKNNFGRKLWYGIDIDDVLAWLEKQGEQKPADGQKFKVGDWLVHKDMVGVLFCITQIHAPHYYLTNNNTFIKFGEEDNYRPWTIHDAKDGDVLACENGWICIFKTLVNDETFSSYCFMDNTKWFCETGSECHTLKEEFVKACNGKIYPATKEQRDQLEKAMADAGYTFDFESKELKKIAQEPYPETLDKAIELYYYSYGNGKGGFDNLSLERFKDIVKTFVNDYGMRNSAWTEEDAQLYNDLSDTYFYNDEDYPEETYKLMFKRVLDWMTKRAKSLRPQNTWKPSDEQMELIKDIVFKDRQKITRKELAIFHSIYKDLKKLREE